MKDIQTPEHMKGLNPDDVLQLGPDDDQMMLTLHQKVGGVYEATPVAVVVCPGDTDRTLDLGAKTHNYDKWTEYVYVADGKMTTLANTGSTFEVRFFDKTDFEGTAGADARAMMEDSDTAIFSGDQKPSWSSTSSAPPSTTLGVSSHRVQIDLTTDDSEIESITWYHTASERIWKSGIPTSNEAFNRGAGTGSGWYKAGGDFDPVSRSSIES